MELRIVLERLNYEIDKDIIVAEEDILAIKRLYYTNAYEGASTIENLSNKWFEDPLNLSSIQYVIRSETIPNIAATIDSKQFNKYRMVNRNPKPLKYDPQIKPFQVPGSH